MVVMGFVFGTDAQPYYQQELPLQGDIYAKAPISKEVHEDVTNAVKILHNSGFVLGDICQPNVVVIEVGTMIGKPKEW